MTAELASALAYAAAREALQVARSFVDLIRRITFGTSAPVLGPAYVQTTIVHCQWRIFCCVVDAIEWRAHARAWRKVDEHWASRLLATP